MKNTVQQWLADRLSPPGMLACGLRRPDGKFACRSVEETCPAVNMEKILAQFEIQRASLFADQLAPRWCNWVFEQGQIRFVERPDGWLLGLVARNDSDAISSLDPLTSEFLARQFGK